MTLDLRHQPVRHWPCPGQVAVLDLKCLEAFIFLVWKLVNIW